MIAAIAVVYLAGVAIGLWRVDGAPAARMVIAVLWPIGPAAAVVTITGLIVSALVLFPTVGAAMVSAALLLWWLARWTP